MKFSVSSSALLSLLATPCIDPVNGVYLFFQFILPDFLLIPPMKKSIQHITKLFHTRLEISVFH